MTKFYLFGGGLTSHLKNTNFLSQLRRQNKIHNILVFPYAKEEKDWNSVLETYSQIITPQLPNVKIHLATRDIPALLSNINLCEVFIFTGGSEVLIKKILEDIEIDLNNIIRGKIIFGNSGGSNIFSEIYFSNDRDKVEGGLGICPIKMICHYDETKKDKIKLLQEFEPADLPIFPLRDEQFAEYEL